MEIKIWLGNWKEPAPCFFVVFLDETFFNGTKDGAILTKIAFLMIAVVIFTFDHSRDILKDVKVGKAECLKKNTY